MDRIVKVLQSTPYAEVVRRCCAITPSYNKAIQIIRGRTSGDDLTDACILAVAIGAGIEAEFIDGVWVKRSGTGSPWKVLKLLAQGDDDLIVLYISGRIGQGNFRLAWTFQEIKDGKEPQGSGIFKGRDEEF